MTGFSTAPAAIRVGDRDRDSAARHLGVALVAGYLDLAEYERRIGSVFAAQSSTDLEGVLADLPVHRLRQQDPRRRAARRRAARLSVGIHAAAYLLMVVVVLTVWLAVALSVDAWYFWPLWPFLGAGIGLVVHALSIRFVLGPGVDRAQCGVFVRHSSPPERFPMGKSRFPSVD